MDCGAYEVRVVALNTEGINEKFPSITNVFIPTQKLPEMFCGLLWKKQCT